MFPAGFPPEGLELTGNIQFSAHGLRLDLLRQGQQPRKRAPAIIHLHGGAWIMYGRWAPANVFLARAGFVTVSIDYRLAPGSRFPAQIEDARTAVRWLRAHADQYGIDPERIGAWGVSAGSHLAGLLGTAADHEFGGSGGGWAEYSSAVQAVGNVCGVVDFADPALAAWPEDFPLFGASVQSRPDLAALASPARHVTPQSAPFLHLHGAQDREVPVSQARRMHAALGRAGVPSELVVLSGGHFINETHQAEVERRLLAFFRQTLAWPE